LYANCHQTFRTSNYEDHKDRVPERVIDTCKWVLEHPTYKTWKNSRSGLLWISADPGCGKSVLAKFLVDDELKRGEPQIISYFFFKEGGDADQRTMANALCAIIHQLFTQQPHLIKYGIAAFRANGSMVTTILDALWDILITATGDERCGKTICILDGLDEIKSEEYEKLISRLTKSYCSTSRRNPSLKFLMTSRPYLKIERAFAELTYLLPTVRLAGEKESVLISQEIDLAITHRCRIAAVKLGWGDELKAYLEQRLLSISHRTYLWLYLIFEVIENHISPNTKERLKGRLFQTPKIQFLECLINFGF
jgi:hypothetical protein